MKCKDINKKLLFYLDNELSPREKASVEAHLASCPDCRRELESLAATQSVLSRGFSPVKRKTAPLWIWVELERFVRESAEEVTILSKMRDIFVSLFSQRPGVKTVFSGLGTAAVVTTCVLVAFFLVAPSPEVRASEIAREDPEVRALVGGEPLAQTAKVAGSTGYVLTQGASGESNLAFVDLKG
jgi:anti-sigma factor RsiW